MVGYKRLVRTLALPTKASRTTASAASASASAAAAILFRGHVNYSSASALALLPW